MSRMSFFRHYPPKIPTTYVRTTKASYSKTQYLRIYQWYEKLHIVANSLTRHYVCSTHNYSFGYFHSSSLADLRNHFKVVSSLKSISRVVSEIGYSALKSSPCAYSSSPHSACSWNSTYIVSSLSTHRNSSLNSLWDLISKKLEVFPNLLDVSFTHV